MTISSSGQRPQPVGAGPDRSNAGLLVGAVPLGALEPLAAQALPPNQFAYNDNPGRIAGQARPVAASQFNVGGTS